jgi:hypothetical protein
MRDGLSRFRFVHLARRAAAGKFFLTFPARRGRRAAFFFLAFAAGRRLGGSTGPSVFLFQFRGASNMRRERTHAGDSFLVYPFSVSEISFYVSLNERGP